MKSFCLDLKNKELWNQYWSRLSENRRDIYFSPDYYEIYEKKGDGIAKCFVFEKGDDFLLYPFRLCWLFFLQFYFQATPLSRTLEEIVYTK